MLEWDSSIQPRKGMMFLFWSVLVRECRRSDRTCISSLQVRNWHTELQHGLWWWVLEWLHRAHIHSICVHSLVDLTLVSLLLYYYSLLLCCFCPSFKISFLVHFTNGDVTYIYIYVCIICIRYTFLPDLRS